MSLSPARVFSKHQGRRVLFCFVLFDKAKKGKGSYTDTCLRHAMFPSLVSSSSLNVLLVAYFVLNLGKIRSLFSFDIMAMN